MNESNNVTMYNVKPAKAGTMNNVTMDNVKRSRDLVRLADRIANRLVAKLNAPECRPFFCKCAYKLSENEIELLLESATRPTVMSPKNYFTHVARIQMSKASSS